MRVQARVTDAIHHIKGVDGYHKDVFLPYFLGCVLSRADLACPSFVVAADGSNHSALVVLVAGTCC